MLQSNYIYCAQIYTHIHRRTHHKQTKSDVEYNTYLINNVIIDYVNHNEYFVQLGNFGSMKKRLTMHKTKNQTSAIINPNTTDPL